MPIIKRQLAVIVKEYLGREEANSNVLLISGARQVGKTTLIEDLLKDKKAIILNLYERTTLPREIDKTESFDEFERLLLREINFRPSEGTVIAFDEAQEAKRLGRWIRFFKEKWASQKVIVSGSILSNLFEEGVAYPVGRVEEVVLRPFSFKEYLTAINKDGLREILETVSFKRPLSEADRESFIGPYLSYLQTGGMPAITIGVRDGKEQPLEAWDRLLRQYALDVERHMEEIYKTMFVSALDRIADITCHPIKNAQIISTTSPSYRKLPHLLEVAEKWHLVRRISAQTKHPESSGGLASKRYLFDVGLTNFFINHGRPVEWQDRSDVGNLVFPKLQENFICNEITAASPYPESSLAYYKETRNSREIDFIWTVNGNPVPVEVKSQTSVSRNSLVPMVNFLEQRGLFTGVLVYNGGMERLKAGGKDIIALPAYLIGELGRILGDET